MKMTNLKWFHNSEMNYFLKVYFSNESGINLLFKQA